MKVLFLFPNSLLPLQIHDVTNSNKQDSTLRPKCQISVGSLTDMEKASILQNPKAFREEKT